MIYSSEHDFILYFNGGVLRAEVTPSAFTLVVNEFKIFPVSLRTPRRNKTSSLIFIFFNFRYFSIAFCSWKNS